MVPTCGPTHDDSGVVFVEHDIRLCPWASDVSACERPLPSAPTWRCFRTVTVNVQTLASDPGELSPHFEGRIGYLRDQLEALGVSIAALQETRSSQAESLLSGNFIRLCSGATAEGGLGVELWFAKSSKGPTLGFCPDDLTVVACPHASSVLEYDHNISRPSLLQFMLPLPLIPLESPGGNNCVSTSSDLVGDPLSTFLVI